MDTVIIVILEIGLIATFISLFFFLYVVKVEDEIITEQVVSVTKRFFREFEYFSPDGAERLKEVIRDIDVSTLGSADDKIEENNKKLLNQAIIAVVILMVVSLALATACYLWKGGNIPTILFSTFLALAVVAIVEFCFLEFIVRNYQTIDPNIIRRVIFEGLNKYINP
jgi:hypothetical protein